MTDAQLIYEEAKELASSNLTECCKEIVEWRKSGLLKEGVVRSIASKLESVDEHNAFSIAEQIVVQFALEAMATEIKEASQ